MRFIFLLLVAISLTACSKPQPPPTIEERVLMENFAAFISSLTYDEICNHKDPKSRLDFDKLENVMIIGTQQMLVARMGGLRHIRFPEEPIEDGVKILVNIQKKFGADAKDILKAKGCESEEAKNDAKLYQLYSKYHTAYFMAFIDKSIVARGGRVTPESEMEAAGKPVKAQ